jgi:flagellar hook-length control protein FliK
LLGDISETADSIADFAKLLPESASGDTLLSTASEILDIFSEDVVANTEAMQNEAEAGQIENGASDVQTTGVEQNVAEQGIPEQNVSAQGVLEQSVTGQSPLEDALSDKNVKDDGSTEQTIKTDLPVENKENEAVQNENRLIDSGLEKKFGVDKEVLSNLEHQLQNAGFSSEETRNMLESAKSPVDLLKQITQGLQENGADTGAVHTVITSDEFKKLLSDVVKNSWTMNPNSMKDPKEIDELYDKITKQSKAFENAIASKGGDTQQFNQNSQNMRQNMNFMEQLNNQMIYAQLPLKLSNQNVNSELYVYADKRKLLEKKDGISVMLHLDMDHLGMTDIKVTLTGSNVNARFYLNDQQSVDIVADNMEELADQLKERGFTLTDEVVKRQPQASINQVVDEIIDENAEKSIKRYTFDVKM